MTADTETHPMHDMLSRWKTAFDTQQLDAMADLFTSDALFQGFGPEVLSGREAVRDYYAAVPDYRRAHVGQVHTYEIGDATAGGFADVTFRDPSGWEAAVHLSLVLQREGGAWRIRQYHVSRVATDH
ncbi:YybH family protein [Streptomyces sp. NPDC088354]|uniref:YybH family protein n=1 Tax=unclassified Streptomyces TaxID=2593676 RepID=UPI0029B6DDDB|nr:SgcJ/EcaC family oxidoreductase [Streptomyces sp. MI02-7b]MDX3076159.1 SgcJ/EcaC family oxidoreductase [Streptomyces sp. MI02-7b]